ncbi:MAG: tRNA 4-thiouridine(8) synthase ThiI [Erysipelothrix sp.]|nr:tRNA 4-thiouridine(8) synthase ThiI [Erysipelothrix sp.]
MYNIEFIVCRYGELSTKGKNRNEFTNKLVNNIKSQLRSFEALTYEKQYDRLFIHLNGEDGYSVADELKHVFGLSSFSLAIKVEKDIDVIAQAALENIVDEPGKTFKVISKRNDKTFEHISDTINRHVATKILQNTDLKVDVRNPDINVWVEIRQEAAYIMMNKIEGSKGYPVGIQGKVLMMLSGGIDSPLASYLLMKRGVHVEMIHFASPPYTSDESLKKVVELAKILTRYQNNIRIHVVPFTDIQLEIYKKVPESYAITMMRRFFLRIGNELSDRRKILAIGNGENLGQVASQTLHSMNAISDFDSIPILSPLLTYDKIEIIDLAKRIGTYETSILPYDDCCTIFTPKNPVTRPKSKRISYYEQFFNLEEMVNDVLEKVETIDVKYHDEVEEASFL